MKYVKEYVNLINVVREVVLFIKVARLAFFLGGGGYLPSLSINYVAISKDMAKKNYHNCII